MPRRPIPASTRQTSFSLPIDKFDGGVITLIDDSRLPTAAAKEATNLMQVADGRWTPRWGTAQFGPELGANPDGAFTAVKANGATELLVVANGALKRVDPVAGTATTITGASFTVGKRCSFVQIGSFVYIANGTDPLVRYDFTALQPYVALATPTAVGSFSLSGLAAGSYRAYYQVVAYNSVGHTPASPEAFTTINKARDTWIAGTDKITFSWSAVTNATRYEIYYSDTSGQEILLVDLPANVLSYTDDGSAQPNPYVDTPVDNTTGGPIVSDLSLSGRRMWATGDPSNPWRIYFTGTGQYTGSFSPFAGGGYVDLEKGGRDRPVKTEHFRDGRGGQQATAFCSNPEGTGSIWQINLVDVTVGTITFTDPQAVKIQGFSGTSAPLSVVAVWDSILYANRRGVFSLGSKPNLLNVLSTDELSANVRPFFRGLRGGGLTNIAAYHFDAKVLFAVPFGGSSNDRVVIFDTERRNWALSWDLGIKQFFEYTDTEGRTKLLAIPSVGTKLLEFGENIAGDVGVALSTNYLSGLYPVSRNRLEWARVEAAYIELGQPQGSVTFEVLGTEKKRGFSSLGSVTVTDAISRVGWGMDLWSSTQWGRSSGRPEAYSQSSVIRKLPLKRRLLKNVQYRLTSNALNADFTLLSIHLKGRLVKTRDPESYTVV